MKSTLLFLIPLLISVNILGQDFAPVGAKWYYGEGFAFSGNIDYILLTSEKDTLIKNVTCRKITKRHQLGCFSRSINEYLFSRNDSVFFFDEPFNDFQLLYDFNAQKDDSWIIKIKDEEQIIDSIVIKVDSILISQINYIDLKTLYVTYSKKNDQMNESYQSTIIEKIGDLQYMFNWYPWSTIACDANYSTGLRCYQDNTFGLYSTGTTDSCDYVHVWTNISNKYSEHVFNIYPNPTNGIVNIKSSDDSKLLIEMTSILGRLILTKEFHTSTQLDLSPFQNGLYILMIKRDDKLIDVSKVIKE